MLSVIFWKSSYLLVKKLFMLKCTIRSASSAISLRYVASPRPTTRSRDYNSTTTVSGFLKHGITDSFIMMVIKRISSSMCLRTSRRPAVIRLLKYSKRSESGPSIKSRYSYVSLNGEFPSTFMLPGLLCSMKPKSMWMMWPLRSIIMFPLWRSLMANK